MTDAEALDYLLHAWNNTTDGYNGADAVDDIALVLGATGRIK